MKKNKIYNIIFCALFTALIAVGAFIRIPLPGIPFSMQTFFTALAGLILGSKLGSLSCTVYLIIGLTGIPIFTGGGGISYLLKPSFGYLIGFIIGAAVTGYIARKSESPSFKRLILACFAGMGIVYIIGFIYFYLISRLYLNQDVTIKSLIVPLCLAMLPGDILKSFLAAFIAKRTIPVIRKYRINNT